MKSVKKMFDNGNIEYRNIDGERHREDGPAVIWADGDKEWWLNGRLHREDDQR